MNITLLPQQFSIENSVIEWLHQKEIRTGSAKTRRSYEDTIKHFRDFLATGGLDLLSNPVDIARVAGLWANMRTLRRNQPEAEATLPVSANIYNQRLAVLSSWYTFVQETYHIDLPNPIKDVKNGQCRHTRQRCQLHQKR